MKRLALIVAATILTFPVAGMSAEQSWYAGVAGGVSSLRPGTRNSSFKVDSSFSIGGGVFVGYDYSPRFSFEGGYSYLGDATLKSANGKSDISYAALSAGALMYVYGDENDIAERDGFIGYLRLGLNSMSNSSSIPLEQEDNTAIWAGVGLEWPLTDNLNLRGELTSFDGDAQTARVSVLYRPRTDEESASDSRTPKATAQIDSTPDSASSQQNTESEQQDAELEQQNIESEQKDAESTQQETAPQPEPEVEKSTTDTEQPSTTIADVTCTAPASNEPIDAQGCALFGGILSGVDFASGTANLTSESASQLDGLAENLLRYNNISIEIQAHTETFNNQTQAKDIAKQRTIAIARQLVERGVPVNRLKARAFGHSRPLAPDDTEDGRQQNNRIELLVLP